MKKRILFLMSDTGGGHRAAANAISEAIHYLYPDAYETLIEDVWRDYTPWPINRIPQTYSWLTGPGLPLWRLMWMMSVRIPTHKVVFPSVSPIIRRPLVHHFHDLQPDLVVSVHPLMNHLCVSWLARAKLHVPFVTVVTDMVSIHPAWICPKVTYCIVPTQPARERALRFGMPAHKVSVCGQPVGIKFANLEVDKTHMRHKLMLDQKRRAVMIVGGGEGFGRVFEIARAIAKNVPQAQLMVVAGRNRKLKTRLEAVPWEIPTKIYGFVDNMPELMGAADILITKAGPGTLSEAFIAGLPPLISGYIPGQERGNVTYVQENGAGAFARSLEEIVHLVSDWMDPGNNALQSMAANAARLARPEASLDIAKRLRHLLDPKRV